MRSTFSLPDLTSRLPLGVVGYAAVCEAQNGALLRFPHVVIVCLLVTLLNGTHINL